MIVLPIWKSMIKMGKTNDEIPKAILKFWNRDLTDAQMDYIWDLRNVLGALVESEKKFDNALLSKIEIESNTKREDWK